MHAVAVAFGGDEMGVVAELIVKAGLDGCAIDGDVPGHDLLARTIERAESQPLQRILDRILVAVFGGMGNPQTHARNPAQL